MQRQIFGSLVSSSCALRVCVSRRLLASPGCRLLTASNYGASSSFSSSSLSRRAVSDVSSRPQKPLEAKKLIEEIPPTEVDGLRASCDGGGGPLGHPLVYINLEKPGSHACGYCGLRFIKKHHQ